MMYTSSSGITFATSRVQAHKHNYFIPKVVVNLLDFHILVPNPWLEYPSGERRFSLRSFEVSFILYRQVIEYYVKNRLDRFIPMPSHSGHLTTLFKYNWQTPRHLIKLITSSKNKVSSYEFQQKIGCIMLRYAVQCDVPITWRETWCVSLYRDAFFIWCCGGS